MWMWAGLIGFGIVLISLYREMWTWWGLGAMAVLTIGLTFVVPIIDKRRLVYRRD